MKELEDTYCEVRKIIELQSSLWDGLDTSGGDEFGHSTVKGSAVPIGGFLEDTNYAWLSNGSRFVVINTKTGDNIASWTFRDKVTCVAQFPTQPGEVLLLLVGLDNGATKAKDSAGMLCIFDCSTSRILRAIRMPAGVEQVCVVNGGVEREDFAERRNFGILNQSSGTACVVLRNLYHIVIDLRRTLWDGDVSHPCANESSPTDIELIENKYSSSSSQRCDNGKHLAYNLLTPGIEEFLRFNREEFEMSLLCDEKLTTSLIYSKKIGCLISGCLGRIIIWQNDSSVGWISAPVKNNTSVSHLALLEPTDDPRPFYYLWVAYQEESFETAPILQMYALLVERKYCDKDTNLHFKIEGEPSVKFQLQLESVDRITGLMSIERTSNYEQSETNNKKGEESLLMIGVSGKMLLFDLNQWYKEQMPRNIRDCQNPNIFLSRYQMQSELLNINDDVVLNCAYILSTLREFPSNGGNSLEELFYPKSLCLDWMELTNNRLRMWMTRGLQWELLREMAITGPSILIQPAETFHRCLAAGLVPFNTDCSFDCDENAQREMLLSLCLEQRWASFLIKCAKEWSDGSVSYLFPMFLKWGAQRASSLKMVADQLCIPLFDQSGSTIGDTEIKLLRFCTQQLECLSNVVSALPIESTDLIKQQRALRRVATHLAVLLWFYDVGLLPETHEINAEALPITFSLQIPYPYERLAVIYEKKREQIKMNTTNFGDTEGLFIDELMTQECQALRSQWEREGDDITTEGYYPPPSLQSLLRSYLLDCHNEIGSDEMESKHQITIYFLMDLVKLLQGSCPDVDQLIKYPSAFKMSPSLIKLTQAFWLLDHEDYQGFLDTLTGQLVSDSDVKDWHHKLVIKTLMRNNEYKLALTYLRVRKPPLSVIADQSTSISLSVECGLIQTAFHQRPQSHYRQLLSCFFQACKACGKLNEILQLALDSEEEEVFVKFLEENKSEETRLLYYLQRCRYIEAGNVHQFSLHRSHLKNVQSAPLTMVNAYNATLPKITKVLSSNLNRKHSEVLTETKYPRPMSHKFSYSKNQGVFETVLKKIQETYVRGDGGQIPFISAPCTSLKLNNMKTDSGCVLFPTLASKILRKRTLDQTTDDDTQLQYLEETKRRKISEESDKMDDSANKKLGASVAFETPLIQRRTLISDKLQHDTETPHSILKIRQPIHNSTPSTTLTCSSLHQQNEDLMKQLERKTTRQIRFSIGQTLNDSSNEEATVNTSNETDKDNASDGSELFYSPNVSGKSQSSDSSYSLSSIKGPRPRPSLRRSNNLSSSESLTESRDLLQKKKLETIPLKYSSKKRSTLIATPSVLSSKFIITQPESPKSPEHSNFQSSRCSLSPISQHSASNDSRYSSRVLPSDSSFFSNLEISGNKRHSILESQTETDIGSEDRREECLTQTQTPDICSKAEKYKDMVDRRKLSSVETYKSTTVTRSILTKTTTIEELSDAVEDQGMVIEVDDSGLDHEPEVCFLDRKPPEKNDLEKNKSKHNKGSIVTQKSLAEKPDDHESMHSFQDSKIPSESESSDDEIYQPREINDDTDDCDLELSALKDKDNEEEDDAECFESFTNSAASVREASEPPDNQIILNTQLVHESERKAVDRQLLELSKHCVNEIFNITEDESSNDINEGNQKVKEKSQIDNKSQGLSGTAEFRLSLHSKDINDSNFTEDESVNSSIEPFENSRSELEGQIKQDSTGKSKDGDITTAGRESHSRHKNSFTDQTHPEVVPIPTIQNVEVDLKKLDDVNKIEQIQASQSGHENSLSQSGLNETDSAISTTSITDVLSSSGPESARNSHKRGKTFGNKNKQGSKSPTPVRMTRARRASSASKEVLISSDASLHLKISDTFEMEHPKNSMELVDPGQNISSESHNQSERVRPKRGSKRPASVEKEVLSLSTNMEDTQKNKPEVPLRRSSRRAASVQREMPTIPEVSHNEFQNDKFASISDTNESESTGKKNQRLRKSHTSQDSDATQPARSRRSTSVVKESVTESPNTSKIATRKRGNSVPKEVMETSRTRRASSLVKDITSEESTRSPIGTKRQKSSTLMQSNEELAVNSPAKNTRSRRLIAKSILEEKEEEEEATLITQARGRSSSIASESEKVTRGKARERRAVSLEPSNSKVKKKTKSTLPKIMITEEAIGEKEESHEGSAEGKSKPTKKVTSRRRTDSATSNPDDNITQKVQGGRKISRSQSRESDVFLFSLPEVADNPPNNEQDVDQVPPYVFSPPHTRSRQPLLKELRREIKNFISPLTMEEKSSSARRGDKTVGKDSIRGTTSFTRKIVFERPKK